LSNSSQKLKTSVFSLTDHIKVKNCLIWCVEYSDYEMIVDATNNKIIDHHWSYKGHRDFSTHILERIKYEPTKKYI